MAIVDQVIGNKALTAENQLEVLNREVVPVVKRLREAVNARAGVYAESFGDGVATVFTITHGLGSTDVLVQVYVVATGADCTEAYQPVAGGEIARSDTNTVQLTTVLGAPGVDAHRVVIR